MAKKITWWQAAEIIGISDRSMRRRERLKAFGYDGLFDRRRGRPSPKRVPLATVEQVLGLYRDRYFDLNVQHFHEKLEAQHGIRLSYSWVKQTLQGTAAALFFHSPPKGIAHDLHTIDGYWTVFGIVRIGVIAAILQISHLGNEFS